VDELASASGGKESDSGVPAGDNGNVRGRHGSVKAPPGSKKDLRGVRILGAEKAPVPEVRRSVIARS